MDLSLKKHLFLNLNIAPLVTFRIVFGAMLFVSTLRFWLLGWIDEHYVRAIMTFKYYGFEWVQLLPPSGMYALHVLMLLASVGVMFGAFYRLSATLLFLSFTYCQLIDLTYYLNHYYFVSLVSLLLIFVPAHRSFSIDVKLKRVAPATETPAWAIYILKFQIALVYICAGIIKINYDWLVNALPLKIWLPAADSLPLIGWAMKYQITPYIFSWAGMLYDTFIILFLLIPQTRLFAYFTVIVFHAVTGMLFQIGVFPLVMIGATLLFFSDQWHEKLLSLIGRKKETSQTYFSHYQPYIKYVLMAYCCFQLLFPWRFLLYNGSMFWTEQGYRFGWRVMLMEKAGTATFYVKDKKTGREGEVLNSDFLNSHQEKQMAMQPDMIVQYAHFLKKHYQKQGLQNPSVRAEVYVTLNGRPSKLLIDPQIDLSQIEDSWLDKKWIINR